jgi:hypothetical protein
MVDGFGDREFGLPELVLAQINWALEARDSAALITENIQKIREAQGVYQLLLNNAVVNIGRTDADAGYFTLGESARLQPLPVVFLFHGSCPETRCQLSNTVPVSLARNIKEDVAAHLRGAA